MADEPYDMEREPDTDEYVRETIRHACGHTVAYATPVGYPVEPVDPEADCGACTLPPYEDPFSEDEIAAIEHEQYCDFHGLPRDPSRWKCIDTNPA